MIKLVAFDLDGTLLNETLTFTPKVKEAIARAMNQGVIVTLATGRGLSPTDQYADALNITAPLICFQGALVVDHRAKKVLHEVRLDPAVIPVIVHESKERGWNLHFECPDMVYLRTGIEFPQGLMDLLKVSRYKYVDNFLTDLPEVPHKFILSLHDPQERNALAKELRETFDQHLAKITVVPSHPVLVEGLPSEMSKAVGVEWLANHFGIKRDEVMCVGDNDNDAEMLQWAGVGVAMSGGSPAALAAADWIAPSVHENGAVIALEKYLK